MTEEHLLDEEQEPISHNHDSQQHPDINQTANVIIHQNEEHHEDNFVVNALFKSIVHLEKTIEVQKKSIEYWKLKAKTNENNLKKLSIKLAKYFGSDQMNVLMGKKAKWSNSTLRKALILRYKLGKNFYEKSYRKKYAPYPSASVLVGKIKNYQIAPGILEDNIKVLGEKLKDLPLHRRSMSLLLDDKAIMPGIRLNTTTNTYDGKCTLLPSKKICEKEGVDAVATNALVVLAVGTEVRHKVIVGFHYTASCTDGEALRDFIQEIVIKVENLAHALVDSAGFDLGPSNISMVNSMGINLTAGNRQYSIAHPNRPDDQFYLKPDDTHSKKNIISALRNNDIRLAECLVKKENLNSNKATFADVKKIYNIQQSKDLKIAKNLKYEIIKPSNFEVMRENTANQAHSIDVISAIEFFDKKAAEKDKNNASAFFLRQIHKFHTIITDRRGWSLGNSIEKAKYECDTQFLKYFIENFLPNVIFSARLKCINGVKMSIRCLLALSELHFERGCERVIPAYFLTDAIENLFSLVTNIFKKPNAITFPYALRIISLNQFDFDPIKGNCS